jgi:hypothetical protein
VAEDDDEDRKPGEGERGREGRRKQVREQVREGNTRFSVLRVDH